MKIHSLLLVLVISLLTLTGCSSTTYYQKTVNDNLTHENWVNHVDLSSNDWIRQTDPWLLTGEPVSLKQYGPRMIGTTHLSVRVGAFDKIIVNGNFRVQIVGGQEHNSVAILGPFDAARQVSIQQNGHTLRVMSVPDTTVNLKKVIVRIGVCNLRSITNLGKGTIYGRNIQSDCLTLTACDCGSIILVGHINVTQVNQLGTGTITVIGAITPCLSIKVKGNGNVNICGRVGIQNIVHMGNGCVNILGADSDSLCILANGNGRTIVEGYVNLKKVTASDHSTVYVYCVNSPSLYISQSGCSRVGLAGYVQNMNIDLVDSSRFEGQYLHGGTIYVHTRDGAHANVSPDRKVFAAALGHSSIYLFGSPNIVSRYPTRGGVILPVWNDASTSPMINIGISCPLPQRPRLYKQ